MTKQCPKTFHEVFPLVFLIFSLFFELPRLREAPGGILPDKLAPRIAETARSMWWVYIILTFAEVVLLLIGEMSLYDATAHAFATVATGGFSTKNASIAAFDSAFIDYTISLFMFLAGVNFFLHYQTLHGKPKAYLKDSEFKFYAGVIGVAIILVRHRVVGVLFSLAALVAACLEAFDALGDDMPQTSHPALGKVRELLTSADHGLLTEVRPSPSSPTLTPADPHPSRRPQPEP